jgi:hypothetical protein
VLPDRITWIGAAIIIGSGLYLIRRERAVAGAGANAAAHACAETGLP